MTQIKKTARRVFDAPVRYRAGVPQITRRFLFADTRVSNITRADVAAAIANDSTSSKLLFSCSENHVNAAAVKAGSLNTVTTSRPARSTFEIYFCESCSPVL